MKFVRTVVVFDRGNFIASDEWREMHDAMTNALTKVVHPPGNDRFVLRKRARKTDVRGKPTNQWTRNGVVPIREQFFERLTDEGWKSETSVELEKHTRSLESAIQKARVTMQEYPSLREFHLEDEDWESVFHQKVGDFDFFTELSGKTRCVIEWETGNISSSHRSMNKLCLVMMAGLIDIGVVVLPSRELYAHLTDRIGNWMELSPYLPLWHQFGQGVQRGMLAVTVVEHDELTTDTSIPYIGQGTDGRSAEGATKLL
ncbi:MAG: hypothetical protein Q8M07_25985 [Prosthecobacter sp.]|nr:hypothetical protein [Prosthecobacter sp.]